MASIYIYSNIDGKQVASHESETWDDCLKWAEENYGNTDFDGVHYSDVGMPVSDADLGRVNG